jgi:hypothetical protein
MIAAGRLRELLAQPANEQIDDGELRLAHPAIPTYRGGRGTSLWSTSCPCASSRTPYSGQVQRARVDADDLVIWIDQQLAGADRRSGMTLRAADDRLDARDQFSPAERFGKEIIGAEIEGLDLMVELTQSGTNETRHANPHRMHPLAKPRTRRYPVAKDRG